MRSSNGFNKILLSDAFWFQEGPGVRDWQFRSSGIKLLNVRNILKEGVLDTSNTDRHLDESEVSQKYSHFLIDEGDLVIASSGISIEEDGLLRTRGAFVQKSQLPLCLNTSTIRFKAKDGISDLNFLRHWLSSIEFRGQITKEVTGIAQKNFGPTHLKRLTITLPDLPEQRRIATILDKADAIRRKRRQAIDLMNDFLRSVFLEMFGDPKSNPKNWEMVPFGTLGECRLGKMLDAKKQTGQFKRPYLRNANVQWNRFVLDDLLEMDFSKEDREEFSLRTGDVLICEGGEVGRAAIWQNQISECYFQKALHRMRLNPNSATPEFLVFLMWELASSGGLKDHTTSATIAHLTGVKLKAIPVIKPPIEKQKQFSKLYYSAGKCLASLHKSQHLLESCTASLEHDFFQGK